MRLNDRFIRQLLLGVVLIAASLSANAKTLLVLGDSLSAAHNIDRHAGWVELLQQKLGDAYRIANASTSGETTRGGLARLPKLLKAERPEVVIIELGGNDGLRGYDIAELKTNLAQMIELAHANSANVLLLGMRLPPNYGKRYNQAFSASYRQLAERYQVALVPFFLEGVGGRRELMQADGIHPNEAAQPILLGNIWPYLQPLLDDSAVTAAADNQSSTASSDAREIH